MPAATRIFRIRAIVIGFAGLILLVFTPLIQNRVMADVRSKPAGKNRLQKMDPVF